MTTISEDDWERDYGSLPNPEDGSQVWEWGHLQTAGLVPDGPVERLWTFVDGDDDRAYVIPGLHIVNRFGYAVTERPWTDEGLTVRCHAEQDDWTVTLTIDRLREGVRFIWTPDHGGEGQTLTATGPAHNHFGTWTLGTEELDFDLEFSGPAFVTVDDDRADIIGFRDGSPIRRHPEHS